MRLVCELFTFENNTGHTDLRTDGRTGGRTDSTSYRDATAHLKRFLSSTAKIPGRLSRTSFQVFSHCCREKKIPLKQQQQQYEACNSNSSSQITKKICCSKSSSSNGLTYTTITAATADVTPTSPFKNLGGRQSVRHGFDLHS